MAKGAGMAKGEERDPVPTTVTVVDTPAGVIEGELYKKSAVAWKLRYFVLRNARLQYFAKRGDTEVRGELELGEGARLVEYDKRPFAFQARARRARARRRRTARRRRPRRTRRTSAPRSSTRRTRRRAPAGPRPRARRPSRPRATPPIPARPSPCPSRPRQPPAARRGRADAA